MVIHFFPAIMANQVLQDHLERFAMKRIVFLKCIHSEQMRSPQGKTLLFSSASFWRARCT